MKIFKIRNKEGLYWEGILQAQQYPTYYDRFSIDGKFWTRFKSLEHDIDITEDRCRPHRNDLDKSILPDFLKDCQIVEFEMVEVKTINI